MSEQCVFCGVGSDSLAHITQCPAVLLAYEAVADPGTLPHLRDAREALMFQCDLDGAVIAGIVAIFAALWDIRAAARRSAPSASQSEFVDLVRTSVCCPWLLCCSPTRSKSERRAERMREPTASPGAVIYKSDGASRGQGGSGIPLSGARPATAVHKARLWLLPEVSFGKTSQTMLLSTKACTSACAAPREYVKHMGSSKLIPCWLHSS